MEFFIAIEFMKGTAGKIAATVFVGLGIVVFTIALTDPGWAQNKSRAAPPAAPARVSGARTTNLAMLPPKTATAAAIAPYILRDTDTDSPGTNNVTRIVTITAAVGGTPPIVLQWEVDHGSGFEFIAGATNATFRIGNAQVADSGLYTLFATNAAGHLHTTSVPLIVTEVED